MDELDPRLTPAREDLAAAHLEGRVRAARYVEPRRRRAATPTVPLTAEPDADAAMTSELLFGEGFDVYDRREGWAWGQSARDGYVGWAPGHCLDAPGAAPTHRVAALAALVFPRPDIKSRPVGALPMGALLAAEAAGEFVRLEAGGFVSRAWLAPAESREPGWVAVAERLRGVPYLWGGRSPAGCDCSGLLQLARQAAGFACPRDSDMQEAASGESPGALARGDLVFWRGHVGIMLDAETLLHANAHHMAVAAEPLAEAEARIAAKGGGPVTARRRWA